MYLMNQRIWERKRIRRRILGQTQEEKFVYHVFVYVVDDYLVGVVLHIMTLMSSFKA